MTTDILWFSRVGLEDLERVGDKNATLGDLAHNLASAGVRVPDGFATSADSCRRFLADSGLNQFVADRLHGLDADDVTALDTAGKQIRSRLRETPFPREFEAQIRLAFRELVDRHNGSADLSWAVRSSSAVPEGLPDLSFAGGQEPFLNVRGIENILSAIKNVYVSLYDDRAIADRLRHDVAHADVAVSVGVQRMVRSDIGTSGVMVTMDTASGFRDAVVVTSAYGLGAALAQGAVNPDEFRVYKPALLAGRPAILKRTLGEKALRMTYATSGESGRATALVPVDVDLRNRFSITDADVSELARQALAVEAHYGRPMRVDWGKDGLDGGIYILRARPETVRPRKPAAHVTDFRLHETGRVLLEGRAVGRRIGAGRVRVVSSHDQLAGFATGDVLVADMTYPGWEPTIKRASAVVTNRGGRTCHAAIIARELGIPAVVGTGGATETLSDGLEVTVSCAAGETGLIYEGILGFGVEEIELARLPPAPVKVMMSIGAPEQAFTNAQLPNDGVGSARVEFIFTSQIGIHPKALLNLEEQPADVAAEIRKRSAAYANPRDYYLKRLAEGVATIAAAFAPRPVIVRMSDFKSNEYANLLGGQAYEPREENPMLGFRGASRYLDPSFRGCFDLECEALSFVRTDMGLSNIKLMIPFVRTLDEARGVIDLLAENGLRRGENGLEIIMMCEVPANALLADEFLDYFDGFSIGSNDMTQLTLGLDRDSAILAGSFDERNPAVKKLFSLAITACKARGKYVGICGQGPSDHPDFAEWLVSEGIDSVSLNPDTIVDTWLRLAATAAVTAGSSAPSARLPRAQGRPPPGVA